MPIITISHEPFGAGRPISERVAEILGYRSISREVLIKASERYGIAEGKLLEVLEEKPHRWWAEWIENRSVYRVVIRAALYEVAQEGNIVYHGRAGSEFFSGIRHVLHVFVDTPRPARIETVMARKGLDREAADRYLDDLDKIRARRMKELFKVNWRDPGRYDMVLNLSKTSIETAARLIADFAQREEYRPTPESIRALNDLTITARVEAALFVASEVEISNLEVKTVAGDVTISGVVIAAGVRDLATKIIRNIPGVTGIKNYLCVAGAEYYLYEPGR
jgi:cytidylate kinase